MNITTKLYELVMNKAKIEDGRIITDESDLVYDLGLDSLSLVELIVDIEVEFDIEIGENDLEKIYKFGTLLSYIHEQVLTQEK